MDTNMKSHDIYDDIQSNNIISVNHQNKMDDGPQVDDNIYSQASGSINTQLNNNPGLDPQTAGIHAKTDDDPDLSPKITGNIKIQKEKNSQINGNVYVPPQINPSLTSKMNKNSFVTPQKDSELTPDNNNIPSAGIELTLNNTNYINPENNPQINGNINEGYTPQTSADFPNSTSKVTPSNVNSTTVPSSLVPLVPSKNRNTGDNCCIRIDDDVKELNCCKNVLHIILGLISSASGIINIRTSFIINPPYFILFLLFDISFILYGILIAISIIENNCLRITAVVFTVIFTLWNVIGSAALLSLIKNDEEALNSYIYTLIFRFILFIVIANVIPRNYLDCDFCIID